uniref:Uncharacterized protein n=1 Tax=viral metagenome TaxID=1070528 RepID=A0A6M3L429_9ZZZZ
MDAMVEKLRRRTKFEMEQEKRGVGLPTARKTVCGPPKKEDRISEKKLAQAIMESYGIYSEIARRLKCSMSNITYRIKSNPEMKALCDFAREHHLDKVEANFFKDVLESSERGIDKDDWPRIKFYLKTQGKKRGYVEETPLIPSRPIQINVVPAGVNPISVGEIEDAVFTEEKEELNILKKFDKVVEALPPGGD